MKDSVRIQAIGRVHSPFRERFGVPRQSGMADSISGSVFIDREFIAGLRDLEKFSHIWVLFLFDRNLNDAWTPTTTIPRNSGPEKVGIFASRGPYRPNPIGISLLKLHQVAVLENGSAELRVSGLDILDGSPVIDLKPYLPYADSKADAIAGFAEREQPPFKVQISSEAQVQIFSYTEKFFKEFHCDLVTCLTEILSWDPRPMSKRNSEGSFSFCFWNLDLHCQVSESEITLMKLTAANRSE